MNELQEHFSVDEDMEKDLRRYIRFRDFQIRVPNSPMKRLWLGSGLTLVGVLPVPPGPPAIVVGVMILSIDNPRLRSTRRKITVWLGRRTWAKKQ